LDSPKYIEQICEALSARYGVILGHSSVRNRLNVLRAAGFVKVVKKHKPRVGKPGVIFGLTDKGEKSVREAIRWLKALAATLP